MSTPPNSVVCLAPEEATERPIRAETRPRCLRRHALGLLIVLLVIGTPEAMSQPTGFDVGFSALLGAPRGDFQDNAGALGFGATLTGGVVPRGLPLVIGLEASAMIYGRDTRLQPVDPGSPVEPVEVVNSNSVLLSHLFVRFQSPRGVFRPYVDAMIGASYLFTHTTLNEDVDAVVPTSTDISDVALSFGPGGGVMYWIWSGATSEERPYDVSVDIRARYLVGAEADYLARGAIREVDGDIVYDISSSRTDLFTLQLGVILSF